MADHAHLTFADPDTPAIPLALITAEAFDGWRLAQDDSARGWAEANGFKAGPGQVLLFPGEDGAPEAALGGVGSARDRAQGRFGSMQPTGCRRADPLNEGLLCRVLVSGRMRPRCCRI